MFEAEAKHPLQGKLNRTMATIARTIGSLQRWCSSSEEQEDHADDAADVSWHHQRDDDVQYDPWDDSRWHSSLATLLDRVGVLLCLLVGTLLWLFTRWLRQRGVLPMPSTAQPRDAYSEDQLAGTLLLHTPSEEDELRAPSPLDERPPGLYPAMTPVQR